MVDANVLVYALYRDAPQHAGSRGFLDQVPQRLGSAPRRDHFTPAPTLAPGAAKGREELFRVSGITLQFLLPEQAARNYAGFGTTPRSKYGEYSHVC